MSELESLALLIANLNTNVRGLQEEGQKLLQEVERLTNENAEKSRENENLTRESVDQARKIEELAKANEESESKNLALQGLIEDQSLSLMSRAEEAELRPAG